MPKTFERLIYKGNNGQSTYKNATSAGTSPGSRTTASIAVGPSQDWLSDHQLPSFLPSTLYPHFQLRTNQ